ncbi:MAG TPA: tetratricopeptide repeat protein [Myxococcales bacterium]|nr:tetratricopeptide repeat protein [Myxococcales bacterium]
MSNPRLIAQQFPENPERLALIAEFESIQRLAVAARAENDFHTVLERCDRAVPLARTALARVLIESLGSLVSTYLGDYQGALERSIRAADHFDGSVPIHTQARAAAALHRSLGNALMGLGDPQRALAEYQAGANACDVAADAWEHSAALYNLGEATAGLGDPERALHYFQQALEAKGRIGDDWGLSYTHAALANLHATVDEPELALEEARRALTLAPTSDLKLQSTVHRTMGEALLALGHETEARDHLQVAVEAASQVGAAPELEAARSALLRVGPGQRASGSSS